MKQLALLLLLAPTSISALVSPQTAPAPNSAAAAQLSHRHHIQAQPKPKAILPAAHDLVNTAQSGASRSTKPVMTMPSFSFFNAAVTHTAPTDVPVRTGHWILLYRAANCIPCDRLTNTLANDTSDASLAQRITIVVGTPQPTPPLAASTAAANAHAAHAKVAPAKVAPAHQVTANAAEHQSEVTELRSKFAALDKASWNYDNNAEAYQALKPLGVPTMYGMDGQHIIWQAAGMPGGPVAMQQRVSSWLSSKSASEIAAANAASKSTNQ